MLHRLPTATVAAALLFGLMAIGAARPAVAHTPFTDIADSQFAANIDWAYHNGITGGCDTDRFCPKAVVTREQMASFLVRMFDLPPHPGQFFADDDGSIHEDDIDALYASGITGGCHVSGALFCPTNGVTREQMASFIARAAELGYAATNPFYDDDFRPHEGDINRIAAVGIGSGCDTYRFCPASYVTREQMVGFLNRLVDPVPLVPQQAPCDRSYSPYLCIPSAPPTLSCDDVGHDNFFVRPPDPHLFDGNNDGVGCEA